MKGALWRDCRHYCKTEGGEKGKTIHKYYGEKFNEYFTKLDRESYVITQVKGCEWERAALLWLEKICDQNPFENSSEFKEDEATTTMADESWDEGGSIISNIEPEIDAQFSKFKGDEATVTTSDEFWEKGGCSI